MAYQVDRFNGTFLTSVDDGTIDTTTDLRLVGKNYAGYGELQNENFVHLLENFSNTTPPPRALTGQIWYDSANKKLRFYDGSKFKTASGAEVSSSAPAGLEIGDFWFDTSADQLRVWNGERYVIIGPEIPDDLTANAIQPSIVKDTLDLNHPIVKISAGSDVIAVISKDEFTLNSTVNPITGFSVIKKGINLVNTSGVTGVTASDHYFWGTASNALKLGGFDAADYIRFGEVAFDQEVKFNDPGFSVGDQNDLRVRIENGDEPVIESRLGSSITVRIRVSESDQRGVAIFSPQGIAPETNAIYDLGSTAQRWSRVYANIFVGNLQGNVIGNTTGSHLGNLLAGDSSVAFNSSLKTFFGTFGGPEPQNLSTFYGSLIGDVQGTATNALTLNSISGSQTSTPLTLAIRDASSNITANRFIGIASNADRLKIDNAAVDTNPSYRSAKTTSTPNTIVARDSSGNITANLFNGTATSARYADLAEKYLADKDYEVGTVVCVGGSKEVTATSRGDRAIGVVSADPAFMMNSELAGGTYIALKGRVPVKIFGKVRKGDRLVSGDNGSAIVAMPGEFSDVFAICLESNDQEDIKRVECVIL